jgi:hypothetical protein
MSPRTVLRSNQRERETALWTTPQRLDMARTAHRGASGGSRGIAMVVLPDRFPEQSGT